MRANKKLKKMIYIAALILLLLTASCGARENPDSAFGIGEEPVSYVGQQDGTGASAEDNDGIMAAVDFQYMGTDIAISPWVSLSYAINNEWLYLTDHTEIGQKEEDGQLQKSYYGITRKRIDDDHEDKLYVMTDVEWLVGINRPLLLADKEGNCFIFWRLYDEEDGTTDYRLEKYGPNGEVLWKTIPDAEVLEGMGEQLEQGTVTRDGRVLLYSYGKGGRVFCFGADGSLEAVYEPELDSLEGIAAGRDDRVYGYCVTGKEPVFLELGGAGEAYVCPMTPLGVYDGYEEGILLRTGEGMFTYVPETGETRRLWSWTDESIQIDADSLDKVYQDNGAFTLLCEEVPTCRVLTFARVIFEDSGKYPDREILILATDYASTDAQRLVRMYNRQSRKYRVKIVPTLDGEALQKQLLRGEGADLMDVSRIYIGDLVRQGAFEDLDPYYEKSTVVKREEILDSVRAAYMIEGSGILSGKNVTVFPGFVMRTMRARGDYVKAEDWTVWKFLEFGENHRMLFSQNPQTALHYCMGLKRYGEHFIDYENKTCSFDGEEFRRILEACSRWEEHSGRDAFGNYVDSSSKEGEWLFDILTIGNPEDIEPKRIVGDYIYEGEDYLSTLIGYPGWEGGEYSMQAYSIFAINSASKKKEGAWDFLEYLLSEELQKWIGPMNNMFPVRKDCFEAYQRDQEMSAEYIERVEKMAEAAVLNDFGAVSDPVWAIVSEEAGMYFTGDADLETTVQKIQNRVQLYLDEL